MNRQDRREAERHIARENAKWPATMQEVPRDEWPTFYSPPGLLRVFRSRSFLVQEFKAAAPAVVRLSVNRTAIGGKRWQDGLSWEELQSIKDQCGYADRDAVEVFPMAGDVVNVANMRHLWIMTEPLQFAWREGLPRQYSHPDYTRN